MSHFFFVPLHLHCKFKAIEKHRLGMSLCLISLLRLFSFGSFLKQADTVQITILCIAGKADHMIFNGDDDIKVENSTGLSD